MIKTKAVTPGQQPVHVEMTQEEIDARAADEAAYAVARVQEELLSNIKLLEDTITPRRLRDAVLGTESPANWLADKETEIAALRAQLT